MKSIIVLLAKGFEEIEALTPVDYLRRRDILVDLISIEDDLEVEGAHGIKVLADKNFKDIDFSAYDGLIIPGGMPGAANLRDDSRVIKLVKDFNNNHKLVSAICAGPIVLEEAKILDGKNVTSYPGFEDQLSGTYVEDRVVRDGNLITARGPAIAVDFTIEILDYLLGNKDVLDLKNDILY